MVLTDCPSVFRIEEQFIIILVVIVWHVTFPLNLIFFCTYVTKVVTYVQKNSHLAVAELYNL
jgi:hypothetical protein